MALETEFVEIPVTAIHHEAAIMKTDGWRFIQTHAVNGDKGIDLYYSFMKDGLARNLKVTGVTKDQPIPSITDLFLAAFVFENEARELFGVDMRDIALDFQGAMYAPAVSEPMTFISPEQKAAREKAAKAAAAKAAKGDAKEDEAKGATTRRRFVMTPERRARLDAKLATMSPEKVAKVEAALKRLESAEAAPANDKPAEGGKAATQADSAPVEKKAAAPEAVDAELEAKLANMDPEKAAKVRAALARKAGAPEQASAQKVEQAAKPGAESQQESKPEPHLAVKVDTQLEAKIALLSPEKAERVRAALNSRAAREATNEGGE